jgi:hypothetical protein
LNQLTSQGRSLLGFKPQCRIQQLLGIHTDRLPSASGFRLLLGLGSTAGGGRGGVQPPVTISNQTLRQVVRVSVGGERLRVVLSNAFGTAPVDIGAAHVALRDAGAIVRVPTRGPPSFVVTR